MTWKTKPKWKRYLTTAGLVCFLAVFAASWLVGSLLCAPAPAVETLPEEFRNSEVSFISRNGAEIRGNFLNGQVGKGVVILMHGVRGKRSNMAHHAEFLHANGFSVLIFDFQAHGESSGEKITSGYLESADALAAVEFARKRAPGEKIGILGTSLGGAAALLAEPPLKVDAMVLEMVYPDIERAVMNRFEIVLGSWARIFSPLLTRQLKLRVGVGAEWFSPERAIAKVDCPKLIIGGALDQHTKLADTKALFAAAKEPKELWIVTNAKHENIHAVVGKEYEERILKFFRCLSLIRDTAESRGN